MLPSENTSLQARISSISRLPYTNYIKTDAKGVTPAMRFGLARGPVKFEDILYFWPWK